MAVVRQYRGEIDDSPWDASGISADLFGTLQNSGRTPPRLWIAQSGGGDAKGWTIPSLSSLAFRSYVQFRTAPSGSNILFRFRLGSEVRIIQNGSVLELQRSGAVQTTSPVFDMTKEFFIDLILLPTSFSWEIRDAISNALIYSSSGAIGAVGPWTLIQTRFNATSQTFLDNIQINDDVSKFIGPEPLNYKSQGQPLYDYGFYYD